MTRTALFVLPLAALSLGVVSLLATSAASELPPSAPLIQASVAPSIDVAPTAIAAPGRTGPVTSVIPAGAGTRSPTEARTAGVVWLKQVQLADGGWGAGAFGQSLGAQSDVATTSMAVLALVRDGGARGPHAKSIDKGVRYLAKAVMDAPRDSPKVNTPTGTQPQGKLGAMVDTHMAALTLGEVAGHLPPELDAEVQVALDRVIGKVQLAQNADGSFETNGWAPVLSSSVAAMSLVKAQEKGVVVAPEVIARADDYQNQQFDEESSTFDASEGAGVELYSVAYNMRADSDKKKRGIEGSGKAEAAARQAVSGASADRIIAGFGSVGGEEMLSYMMISDTLAETGGEDWKAWDGKISTWLASIQNADGSWAGHHCITSQTFVTATALMTLGSGDQAGRKSSLGSNSTGSSSTTADTPTIVGNRNFGLRK